MRVCRRLILWFLCCAFAPSVALNELNQVLNKLFKFQHDLSLIVKQAEALCKPGAHMTKPLVLLVGTSNAGKSTLINHLLDRKYDSEEGQAYLIQAQSSAPEDDKFTVIAARSEPFDKHNSASVHDAHFMFQSPDLAGLKTLGQYAGAAHKIVLKRVHHPKFLDRVILVDSPGMLDAGRAGYDFQGVLREFAEKAALILFMFDPEKPGTVQLAKEQYALLQSEHPRKVVTILNKMNTVQDVASLMRIFGTLTWNIGNINSNNRCEGAGGTTTGVGGRTGDQVAATRDLPQDIYTPYFPDPSWSPAEKKARRHIAHLEVLERSTASLMRRLEQVLDDYPAQVLHSVLGELLCFTLHSRAIQAARAAISAVPWTVKPWAKSREVRRASLAKLLSNSSCELLPAEGSNSRCTITPGGLMDCSKAGENSLWTRLQLSNRFSAEERSGTRLRSVWTTTVCPGVRLILANGWLQRPKLVPNSKIISMQAELGSMRKRLLALMLSSTTSDLGGLSGDDVACGFWGLWCN